MKDRKISKDLEQHILNEFKKMEDGLYKAVEKFKKDEPYGDIRCMEYVDFPVVIDGVIDNARYNVKKGKFDQLTVSVATEGIAPCFGGRAAYCDEWETVVIEL